LMNQLPEDRVLTVHIKMGPADNNTVTLYHKGGDYLVKDEIQVLVSRNNDPVPVSLEYTPSDTSSYNLGDSVKIRGISATLLPGDAVRVVAKNAIVFSGVIT
ncbi:MAG: hypothetical protein LUQ07_04705, partial [Methanospirillum sp.]|nr:hypothetical protein [Methanospirillum sp.]